MENSSEENLINSPRDGENWRISKLNYDGGDYLIRVNTNYRDTAPVSGFVYQIGIAVPLAVIEDKQDPNSSIKEIEDLLCKNFECDGKFIFIAVITSPDSREFAFYAKDLEAAKISFHKFVVATGFTSLQFLSQDDAEWAVYRNLLGDI